MKAIQQPFYARGHHDWKLSDCGFILKRRTWRDIEMFDLLLGDNLQGRKDYISENGYLYIDEADIS